MRALFPQAESMIYVDNASTGLLATPVQTALHEAVTAIAQGSGGVGSLFGRAGSLRQKLAQLINATAEEIALVRSTAHGLNLVANGLDWHLGDNVVTADIEFPTNVLPWQGLEGRYGVKTKLIPSREGRVLAEDLIAACDSKTRLLAVSWVQFTNGYRTDLAQLGEFCRERGILFCVDGIQGVGALQIDVERYKIDALAAGAQKWLLGPLGTGLLYVRKEVQAKLLPTEVGPGSIKIDPARFLDYGLNFHESAARYESGIPNLLAAGGFEASVAMMLEYGPAAIEAKILALADQLAEGLAERGYQVLSPRGTAERSGIISFISAGRPSSELHQRLKEAGVVCSVREGAVRLSPHFYNEPREMERILAALP